MKFTFFLLLSFIFLFSMKTQAQWSVFNKGKSKKVRLQCDNLADIKKNFLLAHINTSQMTSAIESRTIKKVLESFDPMRIYFSRSDMDYLSKKMKNLFKEIEKGRCDNLFFLQDFYIKKVRQRVEFAKKKLNKNFKFNKSIRILLDPEKRGYAKNKRELLKFQEEYIHFQISNRLITGKSVKEAVKLVVRSYDRILVRLEKRKNRDVLYGYLNSFAHSLDPHTSYFSPDALEEFEIQMSLSLEGIGATLTSEDGFTIVDSLVKGGAAERSGKIFPKDKIIAVGQFKKGSPQPFENVMEWELRDVVRLIRGKKDSRVNLKILRQEKGKVQRQTVTLVRDKIKLEDEAAQLSFFEKEINGVKRKVGIINLPSFYASNKGDRSCARDVKSLIKKARNGNVDGLVLDISQNGGGVSVML